MTRGFLSLIIATMAAAGLAGRQTPGPVDVGDHWSSIVQGVRGRLIATATQDAGRPQIRLDLELENVRNLGNPIEIWWSGWSSLLDLSLEDDAGTLLPRMSMAGNEITPPPFWLELPFGSSMRILISKEAYEYVSTDRLFLRPTTFQGWALSPTRVATLSLGGTLTPRIAPMPHDRAWLGPLTFPRVAIPLNPR